MTLTKTDPRVLGGMLAVSLWASGCALNTPSGTTAAVATRTQSLFFNPGTGVVPGAPNPVPVHYALPFAGAVLPNKLLFPAGPVPVPVPVPPAPVPPPPAPAPPPPPAPAPAPPPGTVTPPAAAGNFTLAIQGARVSQFRIGKVLRIDCPGDTPTGVTLDSQGAGANAVPPTLTFKGHSNIFFAGTTQSIFAGPLTSGTLLPVVPFVPGQLAASGLGALNIDLLNLSWPNLNPAVPAGAPIVRTQLAAWDSRVTHGTALDVVYDVETVDATGAVTNTWNGTVKGLIVP